MSNRSKTNRQLQNIKVSDPTPTDVPSGETILPLTKSTIGVVTVKLLNVRSSPEVVDNNVISSLLEGTEILVTPANEEFYKILAKAGDEGYCMKKFIEIRGDHING